jgi:hypothetical protein
MNYSEAVAAETDSAILSVLTNGITLSETGLFRLVLAPRRDAVHKPSRSTCCVLK